MKDSERDDVITNWCNHMQLVEKCFGEEAHKKEITRSLQRLLKKPVGSYEDGLSLMELLRYEAFRLYYGVKYGISYKRY